MILELSPYAFTIGPIKVYWYGIFMAVSFLIGAYYLYFEGKKRGINEDFLLNLVVVVIIGGVVGARLMFVLTNFPYWFVTDPIRIIKLYEGGLSWHGGLLGGLLTGVFYARIHRVKIEELLDLSVLGLTVGYSLVRIGNIFNQEVLGRMTMLGFGRWPAQIIGSLIGVILLIRFLRLQQKSLPAGYQFWSFVFYHQLLRGVFEESVRDNPLFLLGYVNNYWGLGFFTLTQIATPFILLLAYWFMNRSKTYGHYVRLPNP